MNKNNNNNEEEEEEAGLSSPDLSSGPCLGFSPARHPISPIISVHLGRTSKSARHSWPSWDEVASLTWCTAIVIWARPCNACWAGYCANMYTADCLGSSQNTCSITAGLAAIRVSCCLSAECSPYAHQVSSSEIPALSSQARHGTASRYILHPQPLLVAPAEQQRQGQTKMS